MIVESFTPPSKLKLLMTTKFVHEIAVARKSLEESWHHAAPSDVDAVFGDNDLEEVTEEFSEELNESYCLVAYGASKLLKQQACDVFLASAFVLHNIIIKHVRFHSGDFEEQIDDFLSAISKVARNEVDNEKWNELMASEEFDGDSIDLVVGRLFRVVIQAMCDNSLHRVVLRAAQPDWALPSGLVVELADEELNLARNIEPAS
jgi:hypothetical protein